MIRTNDTSRLRVGLYVDVANLTLNGGRGMRYDVLREFACRASGEPVRLNAYVAFDSERANNDPAYRAAQEGFHSALRDFGFKVIRKGVKWYTDENGIRYGKANVDLEMAVDALLQSENIDRVLLATGDGDFVQVVRALQNRGCRVEILAFDSVSRELREEADLFMSGYLVPGLLPILRGRDCPPWGQVGSYVRGVCHSHDLERRFGFIRYLHNVESAELWKTDARLPGSPYRSIFFHDSELPEGVRPADLPSREIILEFQIAEGEGGKGNKAVAIEWVNRKWRSAALPPASAPAPPSPPAAVPSPALPPTEEEHPAEPLPSPSPTL
jgi:uncharacterized LabA/DUF88 family protein